MTKIVKLLGYISKLFQFIIILPFEYSSNGLKRSKHGKVHFFISILAILLLLFFGLISTLQWMTRYSYETKLMNKTDIFCMALLWYTNLILGSMILWNKILYADRVNILADSILKIERMVNIHDKSYLNYVSFHFIVEALVCPFALSFLNSLFFAISFRQSELTIYSLGITLCTLWIRVSFLPIQFLFKYFEFILKYCNNCLLDISKSDNSCEDLIFVIDKYSIIYTRVIENIKFLNQYFGLHVIIYLFGFNFSTIWQIYRSLDLFFIKIVNVNSNHILLTIIFYFCNLLWLLKSIFNLLQSITSLLNVYQATRDLLNDILCKTFAGKVRERVSLFNFLLINEYV